MTRRLTLRQRALQYMQQLKEVDPKTKGGSQLDPEHFVWALFQEPRLHEDEGAQAIVRHVLCKAREQRRVPEGRSQERWDEVDPRWLLRLLSCYLLGQPSEVEFTLRRILEEAGLEYVRWDPFAHEGIE